ncbi:MAG TPA: Grx4 family monothiol glutaredoxin [Thermoanaerobaculia bacterium]|jgi:monothiol glutaredoxin|nr:Grx4 family monothiol glutaredoxin [Thermoanaerobaculia bacterium]
MDPNTKERIDHDVKNNRVFLFMKGTPAFPQCGFSQRAVQLLRHYGVEFGSANVLEDMAIREGIKEYSNWPTIPQLYVEGEFVGGCDIMMELHERGELESVLKQTADASQGSGQAS